MPGVQLSVLAGVLFCHRGLTALHAQVPQEAPNPPQDPSPSPTTSKQPVQRVNPAPAPSAPAGAAAARPQSTAPTVHAAQALAAAVSSGSAGIKKAVEPRGAPISPRQQQFDVDAVKCDGSEKLMVSR
jgi:hypothetical protein